MPMPTSIFTPIQSASRMSPGLPASASRFSAVSADEALLRRDAGPRKSGDERAQGAFGEGLLELELFEVASLDVAQLSQPGLDRIDRSAAGESHEDQEDPEARHAGKDVHHVRPRC